MDIPQNISLLVHRIYNIPKSGYSKILQNIVYLHICNQNKSKGMELLQNKNPFTVSHIL